MLKGSEAPNEWIILGCHLDSWGYGATDPSSGTAMLLSLSETLGKLKENGYSPKRSILIAHWDERAWSYWFNRVGRADER